MRKTITFLLLAVFPVLLYNCSTKSGLCKPNSNWSVTYAEANPGTQEIIGTVPPDTSAICFIRFPQFVKCAGRMFAQIDGEEIGPVATHTHTISYVPPGEHEVTASGNSIWSVNVLSAPGRLRLETFPGRAYFVSGVFDEGSVSLRLLSEEEADELIQESRRILTQQELNP